MIGLRSWGAIALLVAGAGCQTDAAGPAADAKARAQAIESAAVPGKIAVGCVGGDAIDAAVRESILATARAAFDHVRAGDLEALWAGLHPQAQRAGQQDAFAEAIRAAAARLEGAQGEPSIESVHFVDVRGGASDLAKVQCGDAKDPAAFELVANAGNEDVAVVTFVSDGDPFAFATTLQLRKRGQQWRLLGVQAGLARYRGKGAEEFEQLGDALAKQQKIVPGYLALAVAQQLAARGSAIKSHRHARIEEKLAAMEGSELLKAEIGPLQVGGKTYEIAGFAVASTKSDLSPVIKYVTPGGLIREVLDGEADQLLAHVSTRWPELRDTFDAVVFEAYAEAPTEPGREYEAYRIARYFDPGKQPPAG
jgi:hypothetical protein